MSGRRSYARFNISPSSEGVLRVLRDVTVQGAHNDEIVVIGREAGVIGELMTIEVTESPATIDGHVRVIESVPVIVDGAVRHRLRLRRVSSGVGSPFGPAADGQPQSQAVPEETR
jgi:hypothetical protein